jgi:phosphate transport system substrate-binding protein
MEPFKLSDLSFGFAIPILRRVVKQNNSQADDQAGITYDNLLLTYQGQGLMAKAGFVRIR